MTWVAPASFSISAEMSPVCAPLSLAWQSWPPDFHRRTVQDFGGADKQRRRNADQRLGFGVEAVHEAVADGMQFRQARRWYRSSSSCRRQVGECPASCCFSPLGLEFNAALPIKIRPQSNRHWRRRALLPFDNNRRMPVCAKPDLTMLDTLRNAAGTWVAKAPAFDARREFRRLGDFRPACRRYRRQQRGDGRRHDGVAHRIPPRLRPPDFGSVPAVRPADDARAGDGVRHRPAGAGAVGRRRGARRAGAQDRASASPRTGSPT